MVVNVAVSLVLFPSLQHIGIALATSVSAWVNVILLAILLARRGHFRLSASETGRLAGILAAAVMMGVILWLASVWAQPVFAPGAFFLVQLSALAAFVGLGAAFYFATLHFTGIQRLDAILVRLRRRR
jgi:putative peptidoglycan lipid II flippase